MISPTFEKCTEKTHILIFLSTNLFSIFSQKYILLGKRKYYFLRASLPTSSVDLQGNTAKWLGLLYPGDGVQNYCLLHQKIP